MLAAVLTWHACHLDSTRALVGRAAGVLVNLANTGGGSSCSAVVDVEAVMNLTVQLCCLPERPAGASASSPA